ncbi:MAG TPA: hypothetical protein VMV49_10670 [Candidatus Deferrimicrobium sp.]|nr:hypothetical protein [Candidatus Deferrimicrobium sp.]
MVVLFSATQIGGSVDEPPGYVYNDNGTPFIFDDDTLDIIYNFTVDNGGFLPIQDIKFKLDLYVNDTTSIILEPGLHLGTAQKQIPTLEPGTTYSSTLTIEMDPLYIPSFILSTTSILILIYVETTVTNLLPVAINISTYTVFSGLP